MSSLDQWIISDEQLTRTFEFPTFEDAMVWMQRVAFHCAAVDHHPTWSNTYNKIAVTLTTHDKGNKVTDKDRALAKTMDFYFQQFSLE